MGVWHTFKPPGESETVEGSPRAGVTRIRWGRVIAAVGLVCGLLLFAHGFGGLRTEAPETARPYQPSASRGAPAGAPRATDAAPAGGTDTGAGDPGAGAIAEGPGTDGPAEPEITGAAAKAAATAEISVTGPGSGETIRMLATAYTLACGNGDGVTATGTIPRPGIIAVDPRVIPHDTLVYIDDYGYFRAEDTGGVIKGDRIDVFMHSRADALSFGKRWVDVKIIGRFEEPGLVKHFP